MCTILALVSTCIFKRYVESGCGSIEFHGHVKGGDSAYTPSDQVNMLLPLDTKWKVYSHSVFCLLCHVGRVNDLSAINLHLRYFRLGHDVTGHLNTEVTRLLVCGMYSVACLTLGLYLEGALPNMQLK